MLVAMNDEPRPDVALRDGVEQQVAADHLAVVFQVYGANSMRMMMSQKYVELFVYDGFEVTAHFIDGGVSSTRPCLYSSS